MGKIILVLGGARSGKSTFAQGLAEKHKKVAFIATAQGRDTEMRRRIKLHKLIRPAGWKTFEEPKQLAPLLLKIGDGFDCLLLDCLTLLVSNLMLAKKTEAVILHLVGELLSTVKKRKYALIVVSNEVGLGLVPSNILGRRFRDIAGRANQIVAAAADEVYFMFSGIPLRVKPEKKK
jgi:adenosylcobinamide kinase/adenosylcobinamide-phosphate guanylyltransferase